MSDIFSFGKKHVGTEKGECTGKKRRGGQVKDRKTEGRKGGRKDKMKGIVGRGEL
jgi:hypothetical protein